MATGMSYLLDTHIFLWWLFGSTQLSQHNKTIIQNPRNEVWVSSASAWEIATKYRLGKLDQCKDVLENFDYALKASRFQELVITSQHAIQAGRYDFAHKDPFDRLLMAQSQLAHKQLITNDSVILELLNN